MLRDAGITHVFTSELRRTIETAAPLAAAMQLSAPQRTAATRDGAARRRSPALDAHDRVLVVGHSNTVPELLRALQVDDADHHRRCRIRQPLHRRHPSKRRRRRCCG